MPRRNLFVLVIAIVMGGVAAFLARNWLETHARSYAATQPVGNIVVAAKPLAFGAILTADDVIEVPWAAKTFPDGAFVTKDSLLKDGRRVVLSPLAPHEPVLRSKVTEPGQRGTLSALLEKGLRAVTIRVDDVRGVAGFILPGDYVDVVLIAEAGAARRENYSEILLQHVKVLAIDQLASEQQEHPTVAKAVTIEVTPEQAQKVLLATNIGKLSLILRRPAEATIDPARRVTEQDLGQTIARHVEPVRPPPSVTAPPSPVVQPSTAKVAVVRNLKREEYTVVRSDR
ncbi:MAG TPA: Flp pilus assembly protein CpaB [Pseudolabrys sp.]|nr:Flp pilus assembly protein CpaB [Pseudolabrys sp.]